MYRFKLRGGIIGGGVGVVLVALFYLGQQLFRLPFLPFDLFDWLARVLPGDLVTLGIDTIVNFILAFNIGESTSETAKLIEQALALFVLHGIEMAAVATDPADLQGRLQPAPGTRPEITPEGEFYRIDINTRPPVIDRTGWELQVDGLFDNPRNLTLANMMAFPAVTQPLTLSCISNRIGGDLISSAEWTGARLAPLLEDLGLQPAQLRLPPLSTLTWVQWRYDWPASSGEHTIHVHATDGEGTLQIGEETGVRPDGATGYHAVSRTVT